jgi:hypothetical protein
LFGLNRKLQLRCIRKARREEQGISWKDNTRPHTQETVENNTVTEHKTVPYIAAITIVKLIHMISGK